MAGFIPVQMAANGSGVDNEYDLSSFKSMLKMIKQAFSDGFDVLILPEGQLNPAPQEGLLSVFPGAYTLAKLSRRPIRFVALHGSHRLWHADDSVGMTVTGRDVSMRAYPPGRHFESREDFIETFRAVVGHFGITGKDLPEDELEKWLTGRATDKKGIEGGDEIGSC
jgi:1-acyl-sn-glycerol-3-phosphate acyltransferase